MSSKRTGIALAVIGVLAAAAFVASAPASTKAFPGATGSASGSASASTSPSVGPRAPKPFLSIDSHGVLELADGQALYYNDQDTTGTPLCTATCARVWHPVAPPTNRAVDVSAEVVGIVSVAQRGDGTAQVTYDNKLLYTFTVDAPGNITGDGVIDVFAGQAFSWHVMTASGQPLAGPSPSVNPTPSSPVPSQSPSAPPTR